MTLLPLCLWISLCLSDRLQQQIACRKDQLLTFHYDTKLEAREADLKSELSRAGLVSGSLGEIVIAETVSLSIAYYSQSELPAGRFFLTERYFCSFIT
jgi:hypothetical protein